MCQTANKRIQEMLSLPEALSYKITYVCVSVLYWIYLCLSTVCVQDECLCANTLVCVLYTCVSDTSK